MAAPSRTFRASIEQPDASGTMCFFRVPPAVMAALGSAKRPPVVVRFGSFEYRSTVAVYGGEAYVPVRREVREKSGVTPGKKIEITLTLDDAPRTVERPADLSSALRKAGVQKRFDAMSFTHQREYVDAIEKAKRPETRVKRIELAVAAARKRLPLK